MLLPSKSMQGFVKLVMGLFVISAVLDPITSLLHLPQSTSIPAWTEVRSEELPVLAGNKGLDIGRNAVQGQFKQILENQIEALVLEISGVDQINVEAILEPSAGGLVDQPQVQQVNIQLNSPKNEMESVAPITIGKQEDENQSQAQSQAQSNSVLVQTIKEKISAFLQIPQEKIFVTQN
jgi:stage III sporulation protein AF